MRTLHCFIVPLCIALTACGEEPNTLEGSAGAYFDLTFDEVRVASAGSALSVIYRRSDTGEVVLRLTLDTEGLDLRDATTVSGHTFRERVYLERVTLHEDEFAPIDGGRIYFEKFSLRRGEIVDGAFEMVLEGGLTLHGAFVSDIIDDTHSLPKNPSVEPLSG